MNTYMKHRYSWSADDDAVLFAEYDKTPLKDLAERLSRTPKAVRERVRQLRITGRWPSDTMLMFAEAVEFVDEETLVWYVRRALSSELVITIDGLGNFRKR